MFAKGCSSHKDLNRRTDIVHLEDPQKITNYHDLKYLYEEIIDGNQSQKHQSRKSGINFYTSNATIKCHSCGKKGRKMKDCKSKLKCNGCGKSGQKEDKCWKLYPKLRSGNDKTEPADHESNNNGKNHYSRVNHDHCASSHHDRTSTFIEEHQTSIWSSFCRIKRS